MCFVLTLLAVLCAIFSTIAAPLPLKAAINANIGTSLTLGSCEDINAKISFLDVKITAVVCLRSGEELPTGMAPNPSTQCSPDIDARINALGLNIRAIVCVADGIKVVATVQ
ncbi:hypothetical protein K7432_014705 [Basidiobolus ranarum]|uniref:Uncharacterized protein n=1 Tax=Basidiobolus ranarum TaxID=34480 RepID=A0ABR2VPA4_9FUNG